MAVWRDRILLFTMAALLFGVGWIPYHAASSAQGPEHVFHGYLHFPEDMDSYAAFIRQSHDGATLFHNPYAPDNPAPVYWNSLWWLAGKFQPREGIQFPATVQTLRLVAIALLVAGFWALTGQLGMRRATRLMGLVWFGFGAGLGWLAEFIPLPAAPVDYYTELFPFFQATFVPHAGIAHGLLLLLLATVLLADKRESPGYHLLAALLMGLLGSFRPYEMIVAALLIALWGILRLIQTRQRATLLATWLVLLPALGWGLYWFWLSRWAPGFEVWSESNTYPPPPLYLLLLGVGFPLLGLLAAPLAHWKSPPQAPTAFRFVWLWLGVALLLMLGGVLPFAWRTCAPFATPFVLLALLGLERLVASEKRRTVLVLVLLLASLASNGVVLASKLDEIRQQSPYYFQPPEVLRAMRWLGENYPGAVVMTHGHIGMKLPAHGPLFAITGHKDMTADFVTKRFDYHRFINAPGPREAEAVLDRWRVDTVFYGPLDRRFGTFDPGALRGWRQLLENRLVAIYQRRTPLAPPTGEE